MNRGKSSKSNRGTNKNGKSILQNGGGPPSANSTGDGNDVSGGGGGVVGPPTKKAIKANKKSSKAAAKQQVNISTVNSATSSAKSYNNTTSAMMVSHQQQQQQPGNGMNSSAMNNNKAKSAAADELPKKMERSHSFISRGFSKIYSTITGSRDGINKIPEDKEVSNSTANSSSSSSPEPPRFRRSLTLGSFSIKRRSMRESALEKLSEENELKHRDDSNTTSPRDSQTMSQTPSVIDVPGTVDYRERNVDYGQEPPSPEYQRRRQSFGQTSLADIDKSASRYGSGLMSRLKRTLSITSEKRKGMNPSWSASLQNLQSIDNMVSYNDLSFIDYDKFNEIDKRYEVLTASQMQLNRISSGSYTAAPPPMSSTPVYNREMSEPPPRTPTSADHVDHHLNYSLSTKSEQSARQVKRREPKLNTDHTKNLDEGKNLYRQSLDSQKLQFLNERNRESFRFSSSFDPKTVDYLLLDNCASVGGNDRDSGLLSGSGTWKSRDAVTERKTRRRNSEPVLLKRSSSAAGSSISLVSLAVVFLGVASIYLRIG